MEHHRSLESHFALFSVCEAAATGRSDTHVYSEASLRETVVEFGDQAVFNISLRPTLKRHGAGGIY